MISQLSWSHLTGPPETRCAFHGEGYNDAMLSRIITFLRGQAVLSIAFVCACISLLVTGDVAQVPAYIDWRVIALLFCLMAAVAGLQRSGLMGHMARGLVRGRHSQRFVCFALVMLPFFASMLVTNDVALITFASLAALALEAAGWHDRLAYVVVLQTVAANLGGMVTPVGNPQNLFIFTAFELSAEDFFFALAPFGLLAFVLVSLACLRCSKEMADVPIKRVEDPVDRRRVALHGTLFALGLLAVLRVIPWQALLVIVAAALLAFDRRIFRRIDYGLLATFACFFVFSGNLAHMPALAGFLGSLMGSHPMLTSLAASQVISNVPAAVLLAGFTGNWHSLLIGVDLGGLGTPIASLASLISLKIYLYSPGTTVGSFMRVFIPLNLAFLAAMVALYALLFVV